MHPLQVKTSQESCVDWKDLIVWCVYLAYVLVKMESGELTCVRVQAADDTDRVRVVGEVLEVVFRCFLGLFDPMFQLSLCSTASPLGSREKGTARPICNIKLIRINKKHVVFFGIKVIIIFLLNTRT